MALGAALLTAPAALAAPASISVNQRCFVFTKHSPPTMVVTGSGFLPGDTVKLTSTLAGSNPESVTAGPTGGFTAAFPAPKPYLELPGQRTGTLTAEDVNAGATISATAPVAVARRGVAASPSDAPATRKVTWYLAGFRPNKPIYVHYLHPKPVARMRLGRAKGPCGVLQARARFYPGGHPRYRKYNVQIDDARRYGEHTTPRIITSLSFTLR